MDKRSLHHTLVQLHHARYAYIIVPLIVSSATFVWAYRQNNLTAIDLRERLLAVDKANGDVEAALRELRQFTYSHMNANLSAGNNAIYPPIQLKYRYERLVAAEQQRVSTENSNLYTAAQAYCEQQTTSRVTIDRIPCIQNYLSERNATTARTIPDALYKFDFVSPRWSPDLAGWSLLASGVLLLMLISKFLVERWLRWRLNA